MASTISMDQAFASLNPAGEAASTLSRKRQGKLLYKLLVLFLGLALLPLLVAGYQLIHVGNQYIQKQIIGVKMGIALKVASNVTSYLDDKKNTLSIIHKSNDFLTMNSAQQTQILSNVMNAYPMFMRMTVLDLKGNDRVSVNRTTPQPIADRMQALNSIRSVGDYMGPVSRSTEGYPQMTIGVPIEQVPGRPVGYLLGVVNLVDLSSLIKDLSIDQKGYVYIVDMAGQRLVAHPDIQTLLSADPPSEIRAASLAPDENSTGAIEFTDERGHKFLATYATVPRQDWRVFVQQPTDEAYQALTEMQHEISKVLIFVVLLTLIVAYGVSRWIVNRVTTLQDIMEQVGEGNFDIADVPHSNDELGSLTEKFVWMANSLKDKTFKLMMAQKELQKWTSELERRVDARTKDLKGAQEQLIAQEKLAALGQMASVVGHELRNPLAVMNNSVYYLKTKIGMLLGDAPADPKLEKHLTIIESEIKKSNTIISDVLDFSRNRALNAVPRKVDELIENALERIQLPTGVTVRKSLTLGAFEVAVDEDEIRQVLVNLMENACQAMTSGGTLVVGTKAYGEKGADAGVEIAIGDTGCGIPQEHLAKIFAPFFTTKSRGTGLGLAVVKKIVDRHHGRLTVQSKVGEGTTFFIRLPMAPALENAQAVPTESIVAARRTA